MGPCEGMGGICPIVLASHLLGNPNGGQCCLLSLVGGPSTWLNRVMEGGQQLSMGLSILRSSRMSHLVMVTNSLTARYISFTFSARGWASGLISGVNFFPPMLQTLAIGLGSKYRPLPHILIFQPFRDEGSSVETSGNWRWGITLTRRCLVPDFRYMKGCLDFMGKPAEVCHARNGLQFSPPGGGA